MLLLCHMSHLFYFQKAGVQIHTVVHTAEESEAGIMLILSDGSVCGIVASTWPVTNRFGWLPAVQQLHPPRLFWSNQYVWITNNICVIRGTN